MGRRNSLMMWILVCLAVAAPKAQQASPASAAGDPLLAAAQGKAKLTSVLTVQGSVSVQAVLLPPNVVRGVFGKAVSDRYAAVELTVSNRSKDAALVVHSIFIDNSQWLFSGRAQEQAPLCPPTEPSHPTASKTPPSDTRALPLPECRNPPDPWETENKPTQIAAAESRIARGQLLASQPWTARNIIVRVAETVGSVAAGYLFTVKEANAAKSVAAYNGNFLPALRSLVPDSVIDQANRINDLGFRVNKVIPKESSDVLVAFFPLDRFLTPGVKKLFDKSPAIFFVPESILFDSKTRKMLMDAAEGLITEEGLQSVRDALTRTNADERKQALATNPTLQLLQRISLTNIRVVVGGTMTVDIDGVPAAIESVDFDETDRARLWLEPGLKKGTIHGRYLSGGKVVVVNADAAQISDVNTVAEGSDDGTLRFELKLNKPLPSTVTTITFRVDKAKAQRTITGATFDYPVRIPPPIAARITSAKRSGDTLTILGGGFFNTDLNPLGVNLQPLGGGGKSKAVADFKNRTLDKIEIDLAPLKLDPACWTPEVVVGAMKTVAMESFAQAPAPKIQAAQAKGTRVTVVGTQFVDLAACGQPLAFEIAEDTPGATFEKVSQLKIEDAQHASFDLPSTPAGGKFNVRVLVNGVEAGRAGIH